MTEKELWGYFGKKVKVKCVTGETIKGIVKGFTRAIDNDPEVASIEIPYSDNGSYEIMANEISIRIAPDSTFDKNTVSFFTGNVCVK